MSSSSLADRTLTGAVDRGPLGRVPVSVWLAGPYVLLLIGALVVPLAHLAAISFMTHHSRAMFLAEPTLANYVRLLDPYYLEVLVRTLRIGAVTTVSCVLIGTPLAYWLARCRPRALAIGLFLVVMPMMVSTVVRAFGWMILLGRNGLINAWSVDLGIGRWLYVMNTETAVVIALIQICLPLVVLPTMVSIEKIPIALEEAATNLGATPAQLFRRVVIPLAVPGIASGSVLAFVVAISVVVTPALMGGRTSRMIGNEIYDQVVTALNWPFAAAMALVLILVVLSVMAAGYWMAGAVQARSAAERG
jgi:putative spermidine/putrescine transport system permease protein